MNLENVRKNGIIVYGAGRIGCGFYELLKDNNINAFLWDQNADNLKESLNYENLSVPDYDLKDKLPVVVCVNAKKIYISILKKLKGNGFNDVIWYRDIEANQFCGYGSGRFSNNKHCNICVVKRGGCNDYLNSLKANYNSNVNFEDLSVVPTTLCSLQCKHCIQHCWKLKKNNIKIEADINVLIKSLNKCVDAMGWIRCISLGGGEIFLYKHWKKLVEFCVENEKIGIVRILTNGVFSLNDEDIKLLNHSKVVVELDNYGEKIGEEKYKQFKLVKLQLEKLGINYSLIDNRQGTWYDYGEFEENGCSEEQLKEMYSQCNSSACLMLDPRCVLTMCGRQCYAKALSGIEIMDETECIVPMKETVETLIKKLIRLLAKDYLEICRYCNGSGKIVAAGEQVL